MKKHAQLMRGRVPEWNDDYIYKLPKDIINKLDDKIEKHYINDPHYPDLHPLLISWHSVTADRIDDIPMISYASLYDGLGYYRIMYYNPATNEHVYITIGNG